MTGLPQRKKAADTYPISGQRCAVTHADVVLAGGRSHVPSYNVRPPSGVPSGTEYGTGAPRIRPPHPPVLAQRTAGGASCRSDQRRSHVTLAR